MPDSFTVATAAARRCARRLLKSTDPVIVADGLICEAMAVWGAATGRKDDAFLMLAVWAALRDRP